MHRAKVVIDTNVLVSALLAGGNPAVILNQVITGNLMPCYDSRILEEYLNVLQRPKFGFTSRSVQSLVEFIRAEGLSIVPQYCAGNFPDEDDRKFYEVAKFCQASLITGNIKHYPNDPAVLTPKAFMDKIAENLEEIF